MNKWDDWMRRVAGMERPELVAAYQEETKLHEKAVKELEATTAAAERDKAKLLGQLKAAHHAEPLIFVGQNHIHCENARRRMGINPNHCKFVYTNDTSQAFKGYWLKPEQIRLVRGWSEGRFAKEVRNAIVAQMMKDARSPGWDALAYAPDHHNESI